MKRRSDGHADEGGVGNPILRAETDRLNALPLAQLASEVMSKAFGSGSLQDDNMLTLSGQFGSGPTVDDIHRMLRPAGENYDVRPGWDGGVKHDILTADEGLLRFHTRLIAEGLQELEHASLVRAQVHGSTGGKVDYAVTRAGRAALERGTVERIVSGGSLTD